MLELNHLYNMDCLDGMAQFPDKYFDLAIVDPPYGLNIAKSGSLGMDKFIPKSWDEKRPNNIYYDELKRVSINQIIWGGNYFPELWKKPCKDFIFWNKLNHHENRSDGELAWTSFNGLAKVFEYMWDGNRYGKRNEKINGVGKPTIRIHPTEKPVQLYKWLLHNYAKPDFKIIDTHAGSCSSVIAFLDYGCDWIAFEIDKDYYEAASKRIENHKMQLKLAI